MAVSTIALGLSAISTAVAGVGTYIQTDAANKAAEFNAKMGELKASEIEDLGSKEAAQHRLRVRQLQGQQRSQLAASGALVSEGTAFDIVEETGFFGNIDAMTIEYNRQKEARAVRAQASLDRSSYVSPLLTTSGTVLQGASRFGGQLVSYSNAGIL
jgi:hypothetical protein